MSTYGERLHTIRKLRGLTQGELAKKVGASTGSISKMERGDQDSSTFTVALARELKCRAEWLAEGKGDMELPKSGTDDYTVVEIPLLNPSQVWQYITSNQLPDGKPTMLKSPIKTSDRAYAITLIDDSMLSSNGRSYPPGTIVFIDPTIAVSNGTKVLAAFGDSDPVFRVYREDAGKRWLVPLNTPQWEKVELVDGWRILGVATFSGNTEI